MMVVRSVTGDAGALEGGLDIEVHGDRLTISLARDYTVVFPFPVSLVLDGMTRRIAGTSGTTAAIDRTSLISTNNSVTIDLGRIITADEEA